MAAMTPPHRRPATSDLDWARNLELDWINELRSAKLIIRFLREEIDRLERRQAQDEVRQP